MSIFKKKIELSDFYVLYFRSIVNATFDSEGFPENFSQEQISTINQECRSFRYALFHFFIKDYLKTNPIKGMTNDLLTKLNKFQQVYLKMAFSDNGYSDEDAWRETYAINKIVSDYVEAMESIPPYEYRKQGYFYLCKHCLKRCGYNLPQQRSNLGNSTKTNEEGVFDIINQLYKYSYDCFLRTVKMSKIIIDDRTNFLFDT